MKYRFKNLGNDENHSEEGSRYSKLIQELKNAKERNYLIFVQSENRLRQVDDFDLEKEEFIYTSLNFDPNNSEEEEKENDTDIETKLKELLPKDTKNQVSIFIHSLEP